MKRLLFLIAAVIGLIVDKPAEAQVLDPYGGYSDIPVPGGATGSFRVGQLGNRWVLATPDGNAFWMRAVADITGNVSSSQEAAILAKYGQAWWVSGGKFFEQAAMRLKRWGMNAIGEYSAPLAWPNPNPDSMPFLQILNPSGTGLDSNAITDAAGGAIKDLVDGTDPAIYTGYRGSFPDVFDPKFPLIVNGCLTQNGVAGNAVLSRWLIGTIPDDRDLLFGFGNASTHPHLGWVAAITAPSRHNSAAYDVRYTDTTVYTKQALANFLHDKYGTIVALNSAWNANYTTFSSDGGWPNGRGLLDESGRNAWMGTNGYTLQNANSAVHKDLDSFLVILTDKYFSITTNAVHSALPGKLIFGPADVSIESRSSILREEGKYVDIIAMTAGPDSLATHPSLVGVYEIAGKPMFCETYLTANGDSPLASHPGEAEGDYASQSLRAAAYAACISEDLGSRGSDGKCPMVGAEWWAWTDSPSEEMNFGLVTNLDNAYDGVEDVVAAGKDTWGYPTGGEAKDYGDLLTGVTQANASVYDSLRLSSSASVQPGRTPAEFALTSVPNPFTQSTTINFTIPESGVAEVSVVNLLGTEVAHIFSGELSAGEHTFTWNATGFPDGMYECLVDMNGHVKWVASIKK